MYGNSHFVQNQQEYTSFYNHYTPQEPALYASSNSYALDSALCQRKADTEFLNSFVDSCTPETLEKSNKKRLGIAETKQLIYTIKALNTSLESSVNLLQTKIDSPEFHMNLEKCKDLQRKIESSVKKLEENERILNFKTLINSRRKKRLREKCKREQWKEQKAARAESLERMHRNIDNWIRKKQEVIEREKQELNLKKNTDLVLADIRGKKSDAKKFLNILRELKNLRKVKASNAKARGQNVSQAADESFQSMISKLIKHWTELDQEYSIEEQALKLMLTTDNEKIIANKQKSSFDEWESAIFGTKVTENSPNDVTTLIMLRYAWDKYINYEGTRIPIGWLMPQAPSSAAWQKFIKK